MAGPAFERKAFDSDRVFGLEALQQPVIGDHAGAGHRGVAHAQLSELPFQPHG